MKELPNDFGIGFNQYYYDKQEQLNKLDLWRVSVKNEHLRGRVLTIIEAVLGGDDRLKSTKDLIHGEFNSHQGVIYEMAYSESLLQAEEQSQTSEELNERVDYIKKKKLGGITSK